MNKEKLKAMLAKKEERKKELGTKSKEATEIGELRSINATIDELNTDIAELRSMIDSMPDEPAKPAGSKEEEEFRSDPKPNDNGVEERQFNPLGTYKIGDTSSNSDEKRNDELTKTYEKRGADLKQVGKTVIYGLNELPIARSVTIDTSGLVIPNNYNNNLNPTFNEVSSIVDLVNAMPMLGGETYTRGFEKPLSATAGYQMTDGSDYTDTDPVFDYVTIAKSALTAYTEISKQASKLPNVNYQSICAASIRKALRKKIAREIILGDGEAGHFTGIFNAPNNVIPTTTDLSFSAIDEETLDDIVFSYGGDEDVEDAAYLILSKSDLAAFNAIRAADGKKLYKIVTKGNTGTISSDESFSVNYILNSNCPALGAASTGTYCMAYGVLKYYEMPVFSDISVSMSTDYKFKQGMTAYAGDVYAGGNVAAYKGFIRIKKT